MDLLFKFPLRVTFWRQLKFSLNSITPFLLPHKCIYESHCTMGLSQLDIYIREICSFAPIFQGKNCFRVKYLKNNIQFEIYLGTSWKEVTAAKEPNFFLKGWWKDVLQIFGTSWISCGSVVLVNENIWEIFAPWRGRLTKKLFWSLLKSRVWLASVQNFNFVSQARHVFRPWLPHCW